MSCDVEDHCSSGVRRLDIERHGANNCGFHLTRSKWDPYPWVSEVDAGSVAQVSGMRPGDCLLEVNGEDIVGQRVTDIAEMVRSRPDQVSLLLWNAGVDSHCPPESLCCGPMPVNMKRLSTCLTLILSGMECPICLDTIGPPASQCTNGHLICANCYTKSERCAVCRIRLSKGRSLFADHVYNSIIDAFELHKESDEKKRAKITEIFSLNKKNKKTPQIKITQSYTNKFLSRLLEKSSSVENLSHQFLKPSTLIPHEFHSNLKVKSLSTSEIFGGSSKSGSAMEVPQSHFDYAQTTISTTTTNTPSYRSLNSLDGNDVNHTHDVVCYCPFNEKCNERIKGHNNIIQHFQNMHEGPLIQYFQSKISFNLLDVHNNTYCILHRSGKYFFLRIDALNDKNSNRKEDNFNDILIWMWFFGDQTTANQYQLNIVLYYAVSPEKVLLSSNTGIFSLCNMSWKDMKNMQRGVFLSSETLKTLCVQSDNIMLNVEIKQ